MLILRARMKLIFLKFSCAIYSIIAIICIFVVGNIAAILINGCILYLSRSLLTMTRGVRNKNPFNIKLSNNSWLGKVSNVKNNDGVFEQFRNIDYGLRAGMQLLRGYIARGYDTPEKIIRRFAPSSENDTSKYIDFVCNGSLHRDSCLSIDSLSFYNLCAKICLYESNYDFTYDEFVCIKNRFRI